MNRILLVMSLIALGGPGGWGTITQSPGETWRVAGTLASGALALNGAGCIEDKPPGNFAIVVDVRITGPGTGTGTGKVSFQAFEARKTNQGTQQPVCQENGSTIGAPSWRLATGPPDFKVEAFVPNTKLKVSSSALCAGAAGRLTATIEPGNVSIQCGSYAVSGAPKPGIGFIKRNR